jgi:hypothetical protein
MKHPRTPGADFAERAYNRGYSTGLAGQTPATGEEILRACWAWARGIAAGTAIRLLSERIADLERESETDRIAYGHAITPRRNYRR